MKEKDHRRDYIVKNPPNLVHFAIAGGARCLPHLVVFRDVGSLRHDLEQCAKVSLAKMNAASGKVNCFFFFFFRK